MQPAWLSKRLQGCTGGYSALHRPQLEVLTYCLELAQSLLPQWAALMPFDLDGAGRPSTLACFPATMWTAAPTIGLRSRGYKAVGVYKAVGPHRVDEHFLDCLQDQLREDPLQNCTMHAARQLLPRACARHVWHVPSEPNSVMFFLDPAQEEPPWG